MPWFKVDDKLHDHRKARAARKAAMGVWVLAGSWAADNLTDGFVPESVLSRWGTRSDAAKLVEVGLWFVDEQDGERGWRFHEWEQRQPTRAEKEAERAAKAAAGRAGGKASGRSRKQAAAKQSAKQGASGVVELPSRPVPSVLSEGDGKPSADPGETTAQTLVAEWIEACSERPPGRVIGQVSRELKAMLSEGIPTERVRLGLMTWHRKRLNPSVLASVVHETTPRRPAADPDAWMRQGPGVLDGRGL